MATAIVLAGGGSRRFDGRDKAFATLDGKPLMAHVLEGVQPVADRIIVSCRNEQTTRIQSVLETLSIGSEIAVDDRLVGPLGGIEDGLSASDTEWSIVVGCDVPFVDKRLFDALAPRENVDAVVPKIDGQIQPLCARYRTKAAYSVVNSALDNGERWARLLPARLTSIGIDASEFPFDAEGRLYNVNTKAELERLKTQSLCPKRYPPRCRSHRPKR